MWRVILGIFAVLTVLVVGAGYYLVQNFGLVTAEEAAQMGEEEWQAVFDDWDVIDDDDMRFRAWEVSARILTAANQDPMQWEIEVFDDEEANAFALPGNKIGLNSGLLELSETDDMLAAIVGHEIAHVMLAHSQSHMSTENVTQLGLTFASWVMGEQWQQLLELGTEYGFLLPYGRTQELEADREGLMYMARAGYDPREAITLWEAMAAIDAEAEEEDISFLSTHPANDERIEQFKALMPSAMDAYQQHR